MRIAIVGTGLIGASLGLAWRAAGYVVAGCDAEPAALDAAFARGAFSSAVSFDEARSSDVLVLATPIDVVCALLEHLRDGGNRPKVTFDVASLQGPVLRAAQGLPGFVATHPMAGREGHGAASADAHLFEGNPWIYEPGDGEAERQVVHLIEQARGLPVALGAAAHDRAVAVTSHLPQLLAVALAECVGRHLPEPGVRQVVGPGLRGALRLANASWRMWRPLLEELAERDAGLVEELADDLRAIAVGLRAKRMPAVEAAMEAARKVSEDLFRNTK